MSGRTKYATEATLVERKVRWNAWSCCRTPKSGWSSLRHWLRSYPEVKGEAG